MYDWGLAVRGACGHRVAHEHTAGWRWWWWWWWWWQGAAGPGGPVPGLIRRVSPPCKGAGVGVFDQRATFQLATFQLAAFQLAQHAGLEVGPPTSLEGQQQLHARARETPGGRGKPAVVAAAGVQRDHTTRPNNNHKRVPDTKPLSPDMSYFLATFPFL